MRFPASPLQLVRHAYGMEGWAQDRRDLFRHRQLGCAPCGSSPEPEHLRFSQALWVWRA